MPSRPPPIPLAQFAINFEGGGVIQNFQRSNAKSQIQRTFKTHFAIQE